jgi:SAM-dependent methyltransferase
MVSSATAGMNPAELANIARCEQNLWWYRGMRTILGAILSRYLAGKAFGRILEAGCGTGHTSHWLRSHYGWNMFPVDLESAALQYVRSLEFRNTAQADIRSLPFRDASFDLVLSLDVLVHVPSGDEKECVAEFFRVLKPGGTLVLRAAAFDTLRPVLHICEFVAASGGSCEISHLGAFDAKAARKRYRPAAGLAECAAVPAAGPRGEMDWFRLASANRTIADPAW